MYSILFGISVIAHIYNGLFLICIYFLIGVLHEWLIEIQISCIAHAQWLKGFYSMVWCLLGTEILLSTWSNKKSAPLGICEIITNFNHQ